MTRLHCIPVTCSNVIPTLLVIFSYTKYLKSLDFIFLSSASCFQLLLVYIGLRTWFRHLISPLSYSRVIVETFFVATLHSCSHLRRYFPSSWSQKMCITSERNCVVLNWSVKIKIVIKLYSIVSRLLKICFLFYSFLFHLIHPWLSIPLTLSFSTLTVVKSLRYPVVQRSPANPPARCALVGFSELHSFPHWRVFFATPLWL